MPNNERLNQQQKATVAQFMKERNGAKITRIRNDSCNYRTAKIDWSEKTGSYLVSYSTELELTPSGKVRREETHRIRAVEIAGTGQVALPLPQELALPPVPLKKVRHGLYPKSRTKTKQKAQKPEQLRLPISALGAKLFEIARAKGCPVQSEQELLSGKVEHYSLEQRRVVDLPQPVVDLLTDFNATHEEWENAIDLMGVIGVSGVIWYIEQLPAMRKLQGQGEVFVIPSVVKQTTQQVQQQSGF